MEEKRLEIIVVNANTSQVFLVSFPLLGDLVMLRFTEQRHDWMIYR